MQKPKTFGGYDQLVTDNCERVLVSLLRGLGPWKESIYLVGGLVPRYLVVDKPPQVPRHAGTGDVDVVVKLEMLADTEAYTTLEENLKKIGFQPRLNPKGNVDKWGWTIKIGIAVVVLELLADDPDVGGGKVKALPTEGNISALNIAHASMVFDEHEKR